MDDTTLLSLLHRSGRLVDEIRDRQSQLEHVHNVLLAHVADDPTMDVFAPMASAPSSVTAGETITAAWGNSVRAAILALPAGTVGTTQLAANAVTSAKIAAGTIATSDIADSAITSAKIANGGVATADIADSAVTTAKLGNTQVTSGKIANGAVGHTQLASGYNFKITIGNTTPSNPNVGDLWIDTA